MDDILEHLPRLLEPIAQHVNKYLATALAIIGTVVAIIMQRKKERKQRRRDDRIESKLDLLLYAGGLQWSNAESAASSEKYPPKLSHFYLFMTVITKYLAQHARLSIPPLETAYQTLSRSVESMNVSKAWLISVLGWIALQINERYGVQIPNEIVNSVADILIIVLPLVFAWLNRRKGGVTTDAGQFTIPVEPRL